MIKCLCETQNKRIYCLEPSATQVNHKIVIDFSSVDNRRKTINMIRFNKFRHFEAISFSENTSGIPYMYSRTIYSVLN